MLIVFLGDSITEGLGVTRTKSSYANLLQTKLENFYSNPVEIINFGASAMQINESREKYENKILDLEPDIIVVAHGNTESVVREQKMYLRYLPKRWRKPGWMDPRPYYSTKNYRRWLEKLESGIRWRVKVTLINIFGGKQWMSLTEFRQQISDFVMTNLNHSAKTKIIILTPGNIEEKYFPGSPESMRMYSQVMKDVYENTKSSNRVFMCDSSQCLHQWNDYFNDRFHPNEIGHDKISETLLDTIIKHSLLTNNKVMKEVSL